jgi:ADP-heptose:LPS heptosyltransferase
MSPRQALQRLQDALFGSSFDRALRGAGERRHPAFLFGWNRGLGDVGLGLVPYFLRIRRAFPGARIEAITRPDLAQVFELAQADAVHTVPGLARGERLDVRAEARRLALDLSAYAGVFENPDLARWSQTIGDEIPPRLHWQDRFDDLARRFTELEEPGPWVGIHASSETARFYRYVKDWPSDRWPRLFACVRSQVPARFVLFGSAPEPDLENEHVVDLRGRTSLLEALAVVRTRCRALVAPDSGILSVAYLLDAQFDLDLISIWADPRQGVLRHPRASPNARLRHLPIVATGEDVGNISVEDLARPLAASLARSPTRA